MPLNPTDFAAFVNALDEDERNCHTMKAAAPGAAPMPTFSDATAKALKAGFNMKQIITAFLGGFATGGFAGGVAAVLALIVTPAPAKP